MEEHMRTNKAGVLNGLTSAQKKTNVKNLHE